MPGTRPGMTWSDWIDQETYLTGATPGGQTITSPPVGEPPRVLPGVCPQPRGTSTQPSPCRRSGVAAQRHAARRDGGAGISARRQPRSTPPERLLWQRRSICSWRLATNRPVRRAPSIVVNPAGYMTLQPRPPALAAMILCRACPGCGRLSNYTFGRRKNAAETVMIRSRGCRGTYPGRMLRGD